MKLDPNKEYVYRNGEKPWKIIWDVPNGDYTILSITKDGDTWFHFEDGDTNTGGFQEYDLIEFKPKIKGWVNIYPLPKNSHIKHAGVTSGLIYVDSKLADQEAAHDRIACIEIEFTEGEGL